MTGYSDQVFDYVIIGSGFGGSVSAMRLTEKGYRVLVLERGKRFRDQDFARTTWNIWKYLWLPAARCFGILQISPFRDVLVLHGVGVGGGSLGYANVLMGPTDELFAAPAWHDLADWKTMLFRCRDIIGALPALSRRLGDYVRTNSESLLGVVSRDLKTNYADGIAITSIFLADPITTIEPVRYPIGSDMMRLLSGPLIAAGSLPRRLLTSVVDLFRRPRDFLRTHILPGWARRTTILLVMQTEDNRIKMRLGRHFATLFRRGLVSQPEHGQAIPTSIPVAHQVTRRFAEKTNGIASGTINEALLNIPMTAHILGGCPFGRDAESGVINLDCQAHNYPGLYIVDGSIVPANPGVNPSLTITALAEYAMSRVPAKAALSANPLQNGVEKRPAIGEAVRNSPSVA